MEKNKKTLLAGLFMTALFILWTAMLRSVDVQPVGLNETDIGFASLNVWFHKLTGEHMLLYTITDWLGLVPIFICLIFAGIGLVQLVLRRSILKVDKNIILLGVYYTAVIFAYLIFEMIPLNYRPVLIEGRMEASYPSSTTLLVLSVMPTLCFQANRRVKGIRLKYIINTFAVLFTMFMVAGRTISG
ncbi:MAG: phosphoesterase PA-phosphatase, partial [Ruminococcus sp.]|nr:phosphoesterase PA-phosphatase [Ruminococcus sp.]